MVQLFCALVGSAATAFSVWIDEGDTVFDLKQAIHGELRSSIPAQELQLYLAKQNGVWLTENEVITVQDTAGLTQLEEARSKLRSVGLSDADMVEVTEEDEAAGRGPMNVLVAVPTDSAAQQSFSWKEPRRLVGAAGADWDFQNALDLKRLASDIGHHYQAWRDRKRGRARPIFMCLDGHGTGKSRLLDEFPRVLKEQLGSDEARGDPVMKQLLRKAYTFKVAFGAGTATNNGFSHPNHMIGTRMLYQLQDAVSWSEFRADPVNHVTVGEVLTMLSATTGTDPSEMCVVLCVDSLHKLAYCERGSRRSVFYSALASLSFYVNDSKFWVIVICTSPVRQPVNESRMYSSQWGVLLPTASLTRPTIKGKDAFDTLVDGGDSAWVQLLVEDMGGQGRALEQLYKVLKKYQGRTLEFIPVMHDVLAGIRQAFCPNVSDIASIEQAFLAVISRQKVDEDSRFGSLSLDQVISYGLIRREGVRLQCSFILYMLLQSNGMWWDRHVSYTPAEAWEDFKPWRDWGGFNSKFRALKSRAFAQKTPVPWTDIHAGARFGPGCDRLVVERELKHALAVQWIPTKTVGFTKGSCSCGRDPGRYLTYQPAAESTSGGACLCLEDATNGFFHEVHQYKCVGENISLEVFEQERSKAAGPDDLFIMYCTSQVTVDSSLLPKNSAFVDTTCWKEYYGPFASRASFIKTVPPPNINTSSEVQLQLVEGISPALSTHIAQKRPFTSLQDAVKKTKIEEEVLKRFTFSPESR